MEGMSSYGDLSLMKVGIGNYHQQMITLFTDTNGTECSYAEYVYLMTIGKFEVRLLLLQAQVQ